MDSKAERDPVRRTPVYCDCCGTEKMAELDLETGKLVIRRIRRNESHLAILDVDNLRTRIENRE